MTYSVAIDVGGTKILIGLVGEDGSVLLSRRYAMRRSTQEEAIDTIFEATDDFFTNLSDLPAPCAIGIGAVGHIDAGRGIWLQSYNIPISQPVSIADMFHRRYGLPAYIDNDVHCAALGEATFGQGRDSRCMVYMNVGTGIGAAVVYKGELIRGADNYAGEVGYMAMDTRDMPLRLEPLASGGGLIAAAREMLPQFPHSALRDCELHSQSIFAAARQGDELAKFLAERAVGALGAALANLAAVFNPDTIVLGGGVVKEEWFCRQVEGRLHQVAIEETLKALKFFGVSALDPSRVGMLGAGALTKEIW